MFISLSRCVSKTGNHELYKYQQKKIGYNFFNMPINLIATAIFNFPRITPTWNAFSLGSKWGQLI